MPCEDGDDDAFLVGVAMSIGEVVGIVKRSRSLLWYCGVGGWREAGEDVSESRSRRGGPSSAASIKVASIESESGMAALEVKWLSQSTRGILGAGC